MDKIPTLQTLALRLEELAEQLHVIAHALYMEAGKDRRSPVPGQAVVASERRSD